MSNYNTPQQSDSNLDIELPYNFSITDGNLCYFDTEKERHTPLCPAIRVTHTVIDNADHKRCGKQLEFINYNNKKQHLFMPMELFAGDTKGLELALIPYFNYPANRKLKNKLAEYLTLCNPKNKITAIDSTGWVSSSSHKAFSTGTAIYCHNSNKQEYISTVHNGIKLSQSGTIKDYQDKIIKYLKGNPLLIGAFCIGLASPLLQPLGINENPIFLFAGSRGTGKTTANRINLSIWGRFNDLAVTAGGTNIGIVSKMIQHSDFCYGIEEIQTFRTPQNLLNWLLKVRNQKDDIRANRKGEAQHIRTFRLCGLATGERSTAEIASQANEMLNGGAEIAILNILANRKYGVFDELHGFTSKELAEYIESATDSYYGELGIAWIKKMTEFCHDPKKVQEAKNNIRDLANWLISQYSAPHDTVIRASKKFAFVGVIGMIGVNSGILGDYLTIEDIKQSITVLFSNWISQRGGVGEIEESQIIDTLIENLERYYSKFEVLNVIDERVISDRWGYVDSSYYYLNMAGFKQIFKGFNHKKVIDILISKNILERGADHATKQKKINGSNSRYYWIRRNNLSN